MREFLPDFGPCRNVAILLLALGMVLFAKHAAADEVPAPPTFTAPSIPCLPTVSDYEHAYKVEDAVFAFVWWCDQSDGLHESWFTGTSPGAITPETQAASLVKLAGTTPSEFLATAYTRESTPTEMELVAKVEIAYAPHCVVTGTAATASVLTQTAQGTLGPAKLDATGVGIKVAVGTPVGCWDRIAKETAKHYCGADTLTDTKGRRVPAESFVACKIDRAPAGGWQP